MRYLLLCLTLLLYACSPTSGGRHGTYKVGIDPTWAPLDFDKQQAYVNGYTEDLLLDIAHYHDIAFEKISANSNTLLEGLNLGHYDAVLTSMPPLESNLAKYDFSGNFLSTGLVLITASSAKYKKLKDLSGELVGVVSDSPATLVLEKNPNIIIRNYPSLTAALTDVANGELEAAVLDRLPASAYIRDLYNGKLKIVGAPITSTGLHAIAKKDTGPFITLFNQSIDQMNRKHALESLEKKWQLQ